MKARQYVIFDKAAERSGPLFEAENDAVAARQFRATIQGTREIVADDYDLYFVGIYDDKEMVFEAALPLKVIVQMPTQLELRIAEAHMPNTTKE